MKIPRRSFLAGGNIRDIQRCYNRLNTGIGLSDYGFCIGDFQRPARVVVSVDYPVDFLHCFEAAFVEIAKNQRPAGIVNPQEFRQT